MAGLQATVCASLEGWSPHTLWVVGTNLLFVLEFWLLGGLAFALESAAPPWLMRYHTQPEARLDLRDPAARAKFFHACRVVLRNQLLNVPLALALAPLMAGRLDYSASGCASLGPARLLLDLGVASVATEVLFYCSHRAMHTAPLYARFHKTHHEWTAPTAITCIYAHPVEFVFGNILPVLAGPALARSHIVVLWGWLLVSMAGTLHAHCGFHVPLLPSNEFHDFHHLRHNSNFGTFGLLDWLLGTDGAFQKHVASERHHVLLGLQSARERFPDSEAHGAGAAGGAQKEKTK